VELRASVWIWWEIVRNAVETIRPLAEAKPLSLRLDLGP